MCNNCYFSFGVTSVIAIVVVSAIVVVVVVVGLRLSVIVSRQGSIFIARSNWV